MAMETVCESFPPVAAQGCRVLMLGSMPGVASLAAQQYYAHRQNAFWPILFALWDDSVLNRTYEEKLTFALSHGIAIWDVAKRCLRTGSSDAAMQSVTANDFAGFFAEYPDIHTIFFNGTQAMALFRRLAQNTAGGRNMVLLPSTSPAHTIPFAEKLSAWHGLRDAAEAGL